MEHRLLDLDIDHESMAKEERVTAKVTVQEQISWTELVGLKGEKKKIPKPWWKEDIMETIRNQIIRREDQKTELERDVR